MNIIYIYASVVFACLKGYHIKLHPDVTQCPLHLPEKKQTQALANLTKKVHHFVFRPPLQVLCKFFFSFFVNFFVLTLFFVHFIWEYLNSMHHRPKEYLLAVIFFAVKNLKTISVQGDMHIFPLTLWCSTIGMNLSLHFVLFVTDNTGFPFFGEKGKMLCFKHRRFSPWPPRSIFREVTIFWKVTDFPHNFISKITLRISSWTFDLWMHSPMFWKQNETINNSNINKTKKQSFPPSHTFPLGAKCGENLVRPVNSIHFHVVSLKNSRLSNKSRCPSPIIPYSLGHLAVVICIACSCYHGHYLIIDPLQN